MKPVLNIYKPVGITPFQIIKEIRRTLPAYKDSTLGYAGRLDPMAEGVLLILIDEENKKRKNYELLEKTYVTEILFGVTTDSYDGMGLVTKVAVPLTIPFAVIQQTIQPLVGTLQQSYPPYSSVLVKGKPLFWWAREGKLEEIAIPHKTVHVYAWDITDITFVSLEGITVDLFKIIKKTTGEFRQQEILKHWTAITKQNPLLSCTKITCRIKCSSGTYIRSLAHNLGQMIGTGAIALSIRREAIGPYTIDDSLRLTEK